MAEHIGGRDVKPAKCSAHPIDIENIKFTNVSSVCPKCNIIFDISLGCPMCNYKISEIK